MSSGVKVARGVQIDDYSFVGMGSSILSNIHIGSGVLIDINSIIKKDVPSGTTMMDYATREYPKNIHLDLEPDVSPMQKVYVAQPTLPDYTLLDEKFRKICESRILSNFAQYSNQLELNIQRLLSVEKALTFPNCTSALMLAFKMLNLTGEVILPSFTFAATGHGVVWNNLTPIFADIDPHTFNIDPDDVECIIRFKGATDSDFIRPPIPIESGHPFWFIPATFVATSESEKSEAPLDNFKIFRHHVSSEERRTGWQERGYPCVRLKRFCV